MKPNKALWEKGDFTRIAATMRGTDLRDLLCKWFVDELVRRDGRSG